MRLWRARRLPLLAVILSVSAWATDPTVAPQQVQVQAPSEAPAPKPTNSAPVDISQAIEEALQLRDPFKSPEKALTAVKASLTELERYPIDQFKLIGVITGPKRLRAMLQDPNGKTHFVSERMRIGTRRGVIQEIRSDIVIVREKVVNVLGKEEALDAEIRMPQDKMNEPNGDQAVTAQGSSG